MRLVNQAHAQIVNTLIPEAVNSEPGDYLSIIISALFILGTIAAGGYLIFGAIKWITSGANRDQHQTARNQVVQALSGLFVLFSIYAILSVFETFFGINLLNLRTEENCETCNIGGWCYTGGSCIPCVSCPYSSVTYCPYGHSSSECPAVCQVCSADTTPCGDYPTCGRCCPDGSGGNYCVHAMGCPL